MHSGTHRSSQDWFLFGAALSLTLMGLATMHPLIAGGESFFERQIIWMCIALVGFFVATIPEYAFLKRTPIVAALYVLALVLLSLVFFFGVVVKGAQQRFDLGLFALQPSDPAKLILIIVLSKYFARRHVEIAHWKHIFISGAYAALICGMVFLQPDLGGAIIIGAIWFGMVLVAGISWRHLLFLFVSGLIVVGSLWTFVLQDYQKARVETFLHPLADIHGTGYNAYQSTVAVGSGELLGKGIGFGTQSKLRFLPEYQTDFIFAAFAEEWGFIGVLIVLGLFGVVIARVLSLASAGGDNFTVLFGVGVAIMLLTHTIVHIGINLGLLPVTGTTIPFMSYGGSHLLTEFVALGMLVGLSKARPRTQAVFEAELLRP